MPKLLITTVLAFALVGCAESRPYPPEPPHDYLTAGLPSDVGIGPAGIPTFNAYMHAFVDGFMLNISSVVPPGVMTLVARHGKIVSFDAYGYDSVSARSALKRDRIVRIFSQTKPIMGVAMMILFAEGRWKLDDPIAKYVPEFENLKVFKGLQRDDTGAFLKDANGEYLPIYEAPHTAPTMGMLMTHTAGFAYGLQAERYGDAEDDFVDRQYKANRVLSAASLHEMVTKIAAIGLASQPGTRWRYSASIDIQGYILEQITGQTLGEFFADRIFRPLGMQDSAFFVTGSKADRLAAAYYFDGTELMDGSAFDFTHAPAVELGGGGDGSGVGGVVTTLDDFARFCQMLLNGGTYAGVRILPASAVHMMLSDHLGAAVVPRPTTSIPFGFGPGSGLGYGMDVGIMTAPKYLGTPTSPGTAFWGGGGGTFFWIDPEKDLFVLGVTQRFGGPTIPMMLAGQKALVPFLAP